MKDSGRRPSIVELFLLERQRQALAATRMSPLVEDTEKSDIEDIIADENNQESDIENTIVHEANVEIPYAEIEDTKMENIETQDIELASSAEAINIPKTIDVAEETDRECVNLKRPLGILRML